MTLLEIILAIIFPPVAVALRYGLSGKFWLSLLLTLIGWLPGVIYAFIVLNRSTSMR